MKTGWPVALEVASRLEAVGLEAVGLEAMITAWLKSGRLIACRREARLLKAGIYVS